jgi:hypothetical protein
MIYALTFLEFLERILSLFHPEIDRDRTHTYKDIQSLWVKYNIAFKKKTQLFYLHKIHMALIAEMNRINASQEIDWVLNFEVIKYYVFFLREKRNGDSLISLSKTRLLEDKQLIPFCKKELDKIFNTTVTPSAFKNEIYKLEKAKDFFSNYAEFDDIESILKKEIYP